MRRRILDLIVCPNCRGTFDLEVYKEEPAPAWTPAATVCSRVCAWRGAAVGDCGVGPLDCARCHGLDIVEGALRCAACEARFPVINGVPRLLRPELLSRMRSRYPEFFARHPEFLVEQEKADRLADTLESFTRQRLDLSPPGPEFAEQWRDHLRRNLGRASAPEELKDRLVLDVGSGFGRHLYVASEAGAETVGIDLSGAVDVARRNNLEHPRCHIVQGDILERPLREGCFDIVWSFGVLHHMPDPPKGFESIVPLARSDGGLVVIWVYGWRGMAFTYRLSHMRSMHRVVSRMSTGVRVRASEVVAMLLSGLYWEPLRLLKHMGLRRMVERMPLSTYVDHPWRARVAGVHDRLSTPITHFHDHDELLEWINAAGLDEGCVESTDQRGWRAYGRRQAIVLAQAG